MVHSPIDDYLSYYVGCSWRGPQSNGRDGRIQLDMHIKEVLQLAALVV